MYLWIHIRWGQPDEDWMSCSHQGRICVKAGGAHHSMGTWTVHLSSANPWEMSKTPMQNHSLLCPALVPVKGSTSRVHSSLQACQGAACCRRTQHGAGKAELTHHRHTAQGKGLLLSAHELLRCHIPIPSQGFTATTLLLSLHREFPQRWHLTAQAGPVTLS